MGNVTLPSVGGVNKLLARLDEDETKTEPSQGTVASFIEGTIHQAFTVASDKLFRLGLMSREERIGLSSAIGEALGLYSKAVKEHAPGLESKPMDPDLAKKLILGEAHGSEKGGDT